MIENLTIAHEAFPRTIRLVSDERLRNKAHVLIVDQNETALLAEIDRATDPTLVAQVFGTPGLSARELVHGVPSSYLINSTFVLVQPRTPNRFNGPSRGAWYAALAVETSVAEVGYHLTQELAKIGDYAAVFRYAEVLADFIGEFVDLRPHPDEECLSPNEAVGYPAGNLLAEQAHSRGLNGIIYPSVRNIGGTCLAALTPHAVQNVAQGRDWQLTWDGSPEFEADLISTV